jgi:hypothetical protein
MQQMSALSYVESGVVTVSFVTALAVQQRDALLLLLPASVGFLGYSALFATIRSKPYALQTALAFGFILIVGLVGTAGKFDFELFFFHFHSSFFASLSGFAIGPCLAGILFWSLAASNLVRDNPPSKFKEYEDETNRNSQLWFEVRIRLGLVVGLLALAFLLWKGR